MLKNKHLVMLTLFLFFSSFQFCPLFHISPPPPAARTHIYSFPLKFGLYYISRILMRTASKKLRGGAFIS